MHISSLPVELLQEVVQHLAWGSTKQEMSRYALISRTFADVVQARLFYHVKPYTDVWKRRTELNHETGDYYEPEDFVDPADTFCKILAESPRLCAMVRRLGLSLSKLRVDKDKVAVRYMSQMNNVHTLSICSPDREEDYEGTVYGECSFVAIHRDHMMAVYGICGERLREVTFRDVKDVPIDIFSDMVNLEGLSIIDSTFDGPSTSFRPRTTKTHTLPQPKRFHLKCAKPQRWYPIYSRLYGPDRILDFSRAEFFEFFVNFVDVLSEDNPATIHLHLLQTIFKNTEKLKYLGMSIPDGIQKTKDLFDFDKWPDLRYINISLYQNDEPLRSSREISNAIRFLIGLLRTVLSCPDTQLEDLRILCNLWVGPTYKANKRLNLDEFHRIEWSEFIDLACKVCKVKRRKHDLFYLCVECGNMTAEGQLLEEKLGALVDLAVVEICPKLFDFDDP